MAFSRKTQHLQVREIGQTTDVGQLQRIARVHAGCLVEAQPYQPIELREPLRRTRAVQNRCRLNDRSTVQADVAKLGQLAEIFDRAVDRVAGLVFATGTQLGDAGNVVDRQAFQAPQPDHVAAVGGRRGTTGEKSSIGFRPRLSERRFVAASRPDQHLDPQTGRIQPNEARQVRGQDRFMDLGRLGKRGRRCQPKRLGNQAMQAGIHDQNGRIRIEPRPVARLRRRHAAQGFVLGSQIARLHPFGDEAVGAAPAEQPIHVVVADHDVVALATLDAVAVGRGIRLVARAGDRCPHGDLKGQRFLAAHRSGS